MNGRLREAILDLDTVNYPRLYQTSPEFHATVDTMVRVLTPLLRLIADDAIQAAQQRALAQRAMMEAHLPFPDIHQQSNRPSPRQERTE